MKAVTSPNVHEVVLELLKNKKGKLLDVGAGEGALSIELKNLGFEVDACDKNPNKFKAEGIKCKLVDLNKNLPYKDSSFDHITCIEVIEHVENPWNLIRELHRIIKKNGTLILSTPNLQNWYSRLYFLLTSKLPYFQKKEDFKVTGHITPIFLWNLEMMVENKFKINRIRFNRSIIPLLRITLPFRNLFFGDIIVLELKKL